MKRHRAVSRRSSTRFLTRAVESLESRQLLSSVPFALSSSNTLTQNWETVDFTTVNDWSAVPHFEGYATAGAPSGTNPGTIGGVTGTLNIAINQTSPEAISAAGNAELEFTAATAITGTRVDSSTTTTGLRTVAFQGSGNANTGTPYIKAYLDTTALTAGQTVRVKYDLIDIDANTAAVPAAAPQQVALQYRTDAAAAWTNVPTAYVSAAAPAGATKGTATAVDAFLPTTVANRAGLEIRVITADALGTDQLVAVENIAISAEAAPVGPGAFSLDGATLSTTEGVGTYNVNVNRSGGTTGAVTVDYVIAAGTAASPDDFSATLTGTLTFADGQSTATIPVAVVQDGLVEGAENFTVTLSNPTNSATLGSPASSTVNITDDDFAGRFFFEPATYSVSEGVGTATLTVRRASGSAGTVTVDYATSFGGTSGTADGNDFASTSGTLTFAPGQTTATIQIQITDDSTFEGTSETFTVTLSNPVGTTGAPVIGTPGATTVTITENDADTTFGTLAFDPATYSRAEDGGTVQVTVKRTGGTTGAVTAAYTTADGAATSPGDYIDVTSGTVSFADGVDTAVITIALTDDATIEAAENFTLTLSSPTGGAMLGDATTATVTILDDDSIIPTGLLINEVFIDPPSSPNTPNQFIEIRGTPGATLADVVLLIVEGDLLGTSRNPGQLRGSIDLTGATIGSNGLLLVKAPTGFATASGGTTVFTTPFFTSGGIQANSISVLLAYREQVGNVPIALGTDLDSDNAAVGGLGTLEQLPANYTILDGVGTLDGNTGDVVYGAALPSVGTNNDPRVAGAIVRFNSNSTPLDASAFYYGLLVGTAGTQTLTFTTDATKRSANFPSGGIVTPGTVNAPADTTAPTVVSALFDPRLGQKVVVTFSEDVSASLAVGDFSLVNQTTGTAVTLAMGAITNGGKTVTLTFTGTGVGDGSVLAKGHYQFKVLAGQVADAANNVLAADAASSFGFINGDFNFDGIVNFTDLVALAQSYNQTSGVTYANGDANYDGRVNFSDLVTLAQNYNQSAPPAPVALASAVSTATAKKKSSFASKVIV